MTSLRPSDCQNFAIQAKLNMIVGAEAYDDLFLGFECGEIIEGIAHIYAKTEYCASRIEAEYAVQVGYAVGSVVNRHIKLVNVLPKDFTDVRDAVNSAS